MKRRSRVKTAIATVSQRPTIPGKPASQLRLWKAGPSAVFPRPKKKKKILPPKLPIFRFQGPLFTSGSEFL